MKHGRHASGRGYPDAAGYQRPPPRIPSTLERPMNLVDRVKRILLSPQSEWEVIDGEAATPSGLYTGYILPLAAIGPIATVIGFAVFGITVPLAGTVYRVPVGSAITGAIVTYVLTLVGVYVLSLIIDALAPTFGGTKNPIQALKVATYSSTAAWVAGIFAIMPGLRMLGLLGLYSIYLLYLGLPVLMKAAKDRAVAYTVLVVVVEFVLFMMIGLMGSRFTAMQPAM
jgi:Yip1 domain